MSSTGAGNIRIAPVNILWQIEAEELLDLSTGTNFDAGEFNLYEVDGTKVRVVFDEDASSTIPSAGAGERILEVDVLSTDSAAQKATKLQTALDADAAFSASVSGTEVTVTRAAIGEVTDAADVDSGISVTTCRRGKDFDLGLLQGEPEVTFTANNFIVNAQQSGLIPRASLYQGGEVSVATESLETQSAKLKEFYKIYGGAFTPGAGTEVFGMGDQRVGANLLVDAARLIMRPVSSEDNLGDFNIMLALPSPDTLTFSGENPRVLSATWTGFLNEGIDKRVNQILVGDASQSGLTV